VFETSLLCAFISSPADPLYYSSLYNNNHLWKLKDYYNSVKNISRLRMYYSAIVIIIIIIILILWITILIIRNNMIYFTDSFYNIIIKTYLVWYKIFIYNTRFIQLFRFLFIYHHNLCSDKPTTMFPPYKYNYCIVIRHRFYMRWRVDEDPSLSTYHL